MNQVEKLLKKNKEIKNRDSKEEIPTDFEINKTMTGQTANTNVIEINPRVAVSSRLTNL